MTLVAHLTCLVNPFSRIIAERALKEIESFELLDGEHDIETVSDYALLDAEHDLETIPLSFLIAECELENVKSYKDLEKQYYAA